MSLVFKPKIKESYNVPAKSVLAKRPLSTSNPITEVDLARIVRSANTCAFHVHDKMLFIEINKRQKRMIAEVMSDA